MTARPARWTLLLLAATLVAVVCEPASAAAFDGPTLRADAELGYAGYAAKRRYHGMFAGAESALMFDGFWGLRAGYGYSLHRSKGDAFDVHLASLGVRYQLDVFEYVPWVDLSPSFYAFTGDGGVESSPLFGFVAGLGFDRLLDPSWSIGAAARYHQLFGEDRFPAYLTLSIRLGYRWTFGDDFAP